MISTVYTPSLILVTSSFLSIFQLLVDGIHIFCMGLVCTGSSLEPFVSWAINSLLELVMACTWRSSSTDVSNETVHLSAPLNLTQPLSSLFTIEVYLTNCFYNSNPSDISRYFILKTQPLKLTFGSKLPRKRLLCGNIKKLIVALLVPPVLVQLPLIGELWFLYLYSYVLVLTSLFIC